MNLLTTACDLEVQTGLTEKYWIKDFSYWHTLQRRHPMSKVNGIDLTKTLCAARYCTTMVAWTAFRHMTEERVLSIPYCSVMRS